MESFTLDFCPRLKAMFDSGETTLPDGSIIPTTSMSTLNNLQVIRHLVLTRRPTSTLEIGLAFGASALTFLSSLSEISDGHFLHTAIDPFQSTGWKDAAVHSIREAGYSNNFQHYEESSNAALPRLYGDAKKFDIVYVDGSHLFEEVFIDFYYTVRILPIGGICLFDDCTDPHVRKVIRFIDSNYRDFLREIHLGGIVRKSLVKRIANRLGYYQLAAFEKIADPPRKWNSAFIRF